MRFYYFYPSELVIIQEAVASDGGSIALSTLLPNGITIPIQLDWSFQSRRNANPQLFVRGAKVERGSNDEAIWLSLLEKAKHRPYAPDVQPLSSELTASSTENAIAERSPLTKLLIATVRSKEYQNPEQWFTEPTPERVLAQCVKLATAGDITGAIKHYRRHYPSVGITQARDKINEACEQLSPSASPPSNENEN